MFQNSKQEFLEILNAHAVKYPLMEPQDFVKLAYQSACGPGHLMMDLESVTAALSEEWRGISTQISRSILASTPEKIGGGLCRYYLTGVHPDNPDNNNLDFNFTDAVLLLSRLLCLTAEKQDRTQADLILQERLVTLESADIFGMRDWLVKYREQNCPPVRHSEVYRNAYHPHYRVIRWEYGCYFPILLAVQTILNQRKQEKNPAVIAIDGRCGSGKSTLASLIADIFPSRILHMDDFYRPISQRVPNWEQIPGGNMELERFQKEVADPAISGTQIIYRPYNCQKGCFYPASKLASMPLTIIEGSYSHHPAIQAPWDLKIFLNVSTEVQARRLQAREGDYFSVFQERWIPLEERYFQDYQIPQNAQIVFDTSTF